MPEDRAPLNVLLVEDDASIRRFVAMALEGEAVRLVEAAGLAEARARLARETFDLLIADLMLGDGNGMELLRELATRPALTRVAFSAGIDRTARAQLADMGVTEVLLKPVSVGALQAVLARAGAPGPVSAPGDAAVPAAPAATEASGAGSTATETAAIERYFGGDRSLFVLYRQQCRAQFAVDLDHGEVCAAAGRTEPLRHLGHSLKSVLSMLGDEGASARARALEDAAAAGDAQAAARQWQALATCLRVHLDGAV